MSAIIRVITPDSSNIESFEYDPATSILLVTFKGGRQWNYMGVPMHLVRKFQKAKSFGKFFNRKIKTQFIGASVNDGIA